MVRSFTGAFGGVALADAGAPSLREGEGWFWGRPVAFRHRLSPKPILERGGRIEKITGYDSLRYGCKLRGRLYL